MTVYLDANIVVALFVPDSLTARATTLIAGLSEAAAISDITALEFAATIAKLIRARELKPKAGREALAAFDVWVAARGRIEIESVDVAVADGYVRRLDVNLLGADALHVAMAARTGAVLATFDTKMRASAKKVGVTVV